MSGPVPGTCRHCGCHGESCGLPNGDKCAWYDDTRTVCTAPACIRVEQARLRAVKSARPRSPYRGWGYGAIVIDKRRKARQKRRRKKAA